MPDVSSWGPAMGASVCLLLAVLSLMVTTGVKADVTVIDIQNNVTKVSFPDMQAGFGNDFPDDGLEGFVVYANPPTACTKLLNPAPPVKGKYKWILLIARGDTTCQFADKVLNAQENNYQAAIVHDDRQESSLPVMGGANGSKVQIPSTFVSLNDGQQLAHLYNASTKQYVVRIKEEPEFDYKMYLWPFAIVVAVCFLMVMVFLIIKFVRDHTRRRLNRLSTKHLKKIPVRKYKKGDYYDTCAICLDEYEEGEKIRVLPCDHVYHTKCIDPWLTKNKKTCPVCKRRVIPGRDADSDDSGSDSDGGSRSESTPLLHGGAASNSTRPGYGGSALASGATAEVHDEMGEAEASGGVAVSDQARSPAGQEREEPQDSRRERRRRRQERERRQEASRRSAQVGAVEEGEEGPAVDGAVALAEGVSRELQRDESREERRERKKKKKEAKRKRRAANAPGEGGDVAGPSGNVHERQPLVEDEDDEFLSAHSSFREVDGAAGEAQPVVQSEAQHEAYINPSYSESQEVVVPRAGRRELNEVV